MEEKAKNNTGLIILLVLLVLGLTGYIVYDKVLSKEEIPTEEKNEEVIEKEETTTDTFETLVGTYTYSEGTLTATLVLNSDGTATYNTEDTHGGSIKAEGKWSIGVGTTDNQKLIYITNELCKPYLISDNSEKLCDYPNCQPLHILYQYIDGNNSKIMDGQITLTK